MMQSDEAFSILACMVKIVCFSIYIDWSMLMRKHVLKFTSPISSKSIRFIVSRRCFIVSSCDGVFRYDIICINSSYEPISHDSLAVNAIPGVLPTLILYIHVTKINDFSYGSKTWNLRVNKL